MKKKVFLSVIMSVMAIAAMADEYTDPQTNVVYTYEPGKTTASVKAGYEGMIDEQLINYYYGSSNVAGDVVILDRFTVGTKEYVVTSIGGAAFRNNRNLKSVSIPETVTDIGGWAFSYCDSLTAVQLPSGLTQIASNLFGNCKQLVSVNIPSSVRTIGNNAFIGCSSLTSLTLPASLTFIGRGAFNGTPWYNALYDEAPDGPFYIGPQLVGYKGDKPTGELVIKEGTLCVGFEALRDCSGLTSVTFPKSITYVDENAFWGCTGLNAVKISDLTAWCGIKFLWVFDRKSTNPLSYARHLYLNGEEVTDLVIPEGVTRIGDYAFDNCIALTSVSFPDGVTSIGTCAFRNCENLTSVTLPPSLSTIDYEAFIWCFNLNAVHISDLAAWCGITLSDDTANPLYYDSAHLYFNGEEVTDLVIPEGVTNINKFVFQKCSNLTSVTFPDGVTSIGDYAFKGCSGLTRVTIPEGVVNIGECAFSECSGLTSVTIPASVGSIDYSAFHICWALASVISWIKEPFAIDDNVFYLYDSTTYESSFTNATLYVPKGCKARYEATAGWKNFKEIVEMTDQDDYRPFVEEGKVWKVGTISGNPVKVVDYYYFEGDTIIGGKTCKQMMCQRFVGSDFTDDSWTPTPSLSKVGAWYEEDKKVYFYDESKQSMVLKYDFSLGDNESLQLIDGYPPFTIGPKQTGGIEGFKGVYRDVMINQNVRSTTWLEGVGGIDGPTRNAYPENADPMPEFLMSCTVGDEVIYLNDEYEDGATPQVLLARKNRFDFTHTIKTRPRIPRTNGVGDAETSVMDDAEESEELSIYGEYSALRLDINLDPLADAYQVHITDEAGQVVYEKTINAGSIVALSIDISAYAKGRYTVTVENSYESFTGEFDTQTAGIEAIRNTKEVISTEIYNLHGQRLRSLQKGLNIVNGKKVFKSK